MTAKIAYNYSTLDNHHEIFIESYEPWIWFFLGALLTKEGIEQSPGNLIIYPYIPSGQSATQISTNDCEKTAKEVVKFIKKKTK